MTLYDILSLVLLVLLAGTAIIGAAINTVIMDILELKARVKALEEKP